MPNLHQLKKELKLTITDNIGNVLKRLGEILNDKEKGSFNEYLVFQSRHVQWKRNQRSGTVSDEALRREGNKLGQNLMDFIDDLEEKDLNPTYHILEETHEKILVVCKTEDRITYMKGLLPDEYFANVDYAIVGEKQPSKGMDIVVFDNTPHQDEKSDGGLFLHYCSEDDPVILYFGSFLPIINHYPEKVYATNSVFSIHARIKELTEYLKYKNAVEAAKENKK